MTPLDGILASLKAAGVLEGSVEMDDLKVHVIFERQGPAKLDNQAPDEPARAVSKPKYRTG